MTTLTINNETTKLPAFFVKQDAKRLDAINIQSYDVKEQAFGNELFDRVSYVFHRSNIYRNYRKKFIAIKVNAPTKADLVSSGVIKLEAYCQANNIDIVKTAKGLVFRINKA
jgi:hypothetical protein